MGGSQASTAQSPMLVARINEKKTELESLQQLKSLSAELAMQMQTLEEKLSTLSNGTEAVAAVLSNWHNVLRAINMASSKLPTSNEYSEGHGTQPGASLPQTLVRIPIATQRGSPPEQGNEED